MATPLEYYRQRYFLSSVVLEEDVKKMVIDLHQTYTLDLDQPIYLIDLDHTILNTNALKKLLSRSLGQFSITPKQFDITYQQAKTAENYYDFHRHLELLSNSIAPEYQVEMVPQKIQEFLFNVIDSAAKTLIYPNIATWLQTTKPRNIMIATSGTGEWQRQKVVACLSALNWEPQAVVLIQNTYKGWVIQKLYQLVQSLQNQHPQLIVIDDNEDELEHIAQQKFHQNLTLWRVKQPNGQYNHKVTNTTLGIKELDFVSHPRLNIAKKLAHP